jgi:hypothetical protein
MYTVLAVPAGPITRAWLLPLPCLQKNTTSTKYRSLSGKPSPCIDIPEGVFIEETPYEERQDQAKEIDMQKRKEDPDFKGAFHEKKSLAQIKKFEAAKAKKP